MSEQTSTARINGRFAIIAATIGGICAIISAIIGTISINVNIENNKLKDDYEDVKSDNSDLTFKINESQEAYNQLQSDYNELKDNNNELQNKVNSLEAELSSYNSLVEENKQLKNDVESLQSEVDSFKNKYKNIIPTVASGNVNKDSSNKKASIFDLVTVTGNPGWYSRSDYSNNDIFIDTYGNEYLNAYVSHHKETDKNSSRACTYLLDNNYSVCEGKIAWSKSSEDSKEGAWIEFYSEGEPDPIYITDKITAESEPLSFSFNVQGVEKLIIVKNGTSSQYSSACIIYSYFNLAE